MKAGYTETTRSGGIHVLFIPDGFEAGSRTLARWAKGTTQHDKPTRLEILGGKRHIVVAPTRATGTPGYKKVAGGLSTVESISEAEYLALLDCGYQLDQSGACRPTDVPMRTKKRRLSGEMMPTFTLAPIGKHVLSELWSPTASLDEMLVQAGWTEGMPSGDFRRYKRPGAGSSGTGAATRSGSLWVYTTSSPIPQGVYHGALATLAVAYGSIWLGMLELTGLPIDWETFTFTELSDTGLAAHFADELWQEYRYNVDERAWMRWSKGRWNEDESKLYQLLTEWLTRLGKLLESVADKQKGVTATKLQHLTSTLGISGVMKALSNIPDLQVRNDELDASIHRLNVVGEEVDLLTMATDDPAPEHLFRSRTAVKWEPGASSHEQFRELVETITKGDKEYEHYLQQVMALGLSGSTAAKTIGLIYGPTNTLKTTFTHLYLATLGDFAAEAPISSIKLRFEKGGQRSVLVRHRAVIYSEIEGELVDPDLLKRISGGDSIDDRPLYGDTVVLKPRATVYFVGNGIPRAIVEDEALRRRIAPLPFLNSPSKLKTSRRDSVPKRREMRRAMLDWLMEGWDRFRAAQMQLLAPPSWVSDNFESDLRRIDPLAQFVEERCNVDSAARTTVADFRNEYATWLRENGYSEIESKARKLLSKLNERYDVTDSRGAGGIRYYDGIAIAPQALDAGE
jgi:P4 family phage/plasmid primase-like protien